MSNRHHRTDNPGRVSRGRAAIDDGDALLESVTGLALEMRALNQQAVEQYSPDVESILRFRSHDVRHIEHTLDGLLDFCGHEPALQLYRRLCRHYWDIDPAATARYETPPPQMVIRVAELEEKVGRHLERMGFTWK